MKPILCKTCLGRYFGLEKFCIEFSFRNEIEFISERNLIEYVGTQTLHHKFIYLVCQGVGKLTQVYPILKPN